MKKLKMLDRNSGKPLYLQAADHIAQYITSNRMPPGRPLPTQNELVRQLGVSKITVRQALQQLAQKGLITSARGKGTFVGEQRELTDYGENSASPAVTGPPPSEFATSDLRAVKKIGAELETGSDRFRLAEFERWYQAAPVGLAFLDDELRFIRVNEYLAAVDGKAAEDHIGRRLDEIVPLLAPQIEPVFRRVIRTGKPVMDLEVHGAAPGAPGVKKVWLACFQPISEASGYIVGGSAVVQDITELKAVQNTLTEQLRFENLLFEISARFINAYGGEIDAQIAEILQKIAVFLEVDRCAFFELSKGGSEFRVLHTTAAEGVEPLPELLSADQLPSVTRQLLAEKPVSIAAAGDLPPTAAADRATLEGMQVRSLLAIPFRAGKAVRYVLGMSCLQSEKKWPETLTPRLKLLAEIFAGALMRKKARQLIDDRLKFERLLTELSARLIPGGSAAFDPILDESLGELGAFLRVDRASIFAIAPDEKTVALTHLWHAPDVISDEDVKGRQITGPFPWLGRQLLQGKPVVIRTLADFPPEADAERRYCLKSGIRSTLMVPVAPGGLVVAAVSLSTIRSERHWTTDFIRRFRVVAEIFGNAMMHVRSKKIIDERLRFEELIANLTSMFVNIPPPEVDRSINRGLRMIGEFLKIERSNVFQFSVDGKKLNITHSFTGEGAPSAPRLLSNDQQPWFCQSSRDRHVIRFSGTEKLPEAARAERAYLKAQGIQAALVLPLVAENRTLGAISFAAFSSPREWPDDLIQRLNIIAQTIANALTQKTSAQLRQQAFDQIRTLKNRLEAENIYLKEEIQLRHQHSEIVGKSQAIQKVLHQVEQVAASETTVLIRGETGTGKDLIAQAIHRLSARARRPMIRVNCAAFPATLIESELFGREKGAYTGALSRQSGRFEAADGSTLFLDEIGDLPLALQAKLLRVIQDGRFERLGSSKTLSVNVRLIAATNRDLGRLVQEGAFRPDLFYRLNVFPLSVPPLRERREDIPLLAWHFLKELNQTIGKRINTLSKRTMETLTAYSWPGNVRELRNVIERAVIVSKGSVLEVGPIALEGDDDGRSMTLAAAERRHILEVLNLCGWRISGKKGAAELLGLKPSTLHSRMKKLGIKRPR